MIKQIGQYSILVSLLWVAACGFRPIYATDGENAQLRAQLQMVEISYPATRLNQSLAQSLQRFIRPEGISKTKHYTLTLDANASHGALGIQLDQEVTRYKTTVYVVYKLIDKRTGALIGEGQLQRQGGYDVVESEYAEHVSRHDLEMRVTKELAEDLKLDIMSAFLSAQRVNE